MIERLPIDGPESIAPDLTSIDEPVRRHLGGNGPGHVAVGGEAIDGIIAYTDPGIVEQNMRIWVVDGMVRQDNRLVCPPLVVTW